VVTPREAVGAHYGLTDWLIQRVTAIVMTLYALLLAAIALFHGGIDHALWRVLFAHGGFKIASFLFMAALLYHAWVGAREIYMDYLRPAGVRLAVQAATIVLLVAYLGWTIQILWGAHA
jgi:succinate dehydrogenase / fumarate reductase membrane anchor subunit